MQINWGAQSLANFSKDLLRRGMNRKRGEIGHGTFIGSTKNVGCISGERDLSLETKKRVIKKNSRNVFSKRPSYVSRRTVLKGKQSNWGISCQRREAPGGDKELRFRGNRLTPGGVIRKECLLYSRLTGAMDSVGGVDMALQ